MKANDSSIMDFIGSNNKTVFKIPPFQRNYEWGQDNCEELLKDIITSYETGKHHYLSNIVYFESDDSTQVFRKLIIIDGQQRITTILLLLAAIRDLSTDEDLRDSINDDFLFNKKKEEKYRLKIKQIDADDNVFTEIMEGKDCNNKESKMYKNYNFLKHELSKCNYPLEGIFEAIGNLEIVCVDLKIQNDLSSVQKIFEKINSTGKPLSSADLIRNYLLISKNDEEQESLYRNYWRIIEKNIPDENAISKFAKDYLTLQMLDEIKEDNVYKEFKNHFDNTNMSHEDILKDMLEYSKFFAWVCYSSSPNEKLNKYIHELNSLNSKDVYPLYIYLLRNLYEKSIDNLLEIFNLLVCFLLRYRIVSPHGGSSDLRNVVLKMLDKLMTAEIDPDYEDILFFLSNSSSKGGRFPDDTDFKDALKKSQRHNYTYGAVLLRRIENFETKNSDVKLDDITVEHFMPQTFDKKGWWEKNLGGKLESQEIFNTYINCIGNLGIMSGPYNSQNSNKPWDFKKQQIKEVQFSVTRDVLKYGDWKKEQIMERNEDMANRACKAIIPPLERTIPFMNIEFENGTYSASDTLTDMTGTSLKDVIYEDRSLNIAAWRTYFNEMCSLVNSIDKIKFSEIVTNNIIHKANSTYVANQKDPIISDNPENLIEALPIKNTNYYSEGSLASNRAMAYAKQLLDEFDLADKIQLLVEKKNKNNEDD